jgi:hypothetical protein
MTVSDHSQRSGRGNAPHPPRSARRPRPARGERFVQGDFLSAHSRESGNGWVPASWERAAGALYSFNSRCALPERIFALSASESGTVSIHSIAGGFITNGQSTANRI